MKLDTARIESHCARPGTPITLLHGPDSGLAAERALQLVKSVPGAAADPFRYAELFSPDAATFLSEATAAALTGGQRVIRVRDATDALAKAIESLTNPEALIVLEAGELTAKSKLRAAAEKALHVATIACYPIDPPRLAGALTARLRAAGKVIDSDAAAYAAANLTGEAGPLAAAVELLALYAGTENRLTLADVTAALPDGGASSLSDAIDAALAGDAAAADRAVTLAFEDGVSPIALLRTLLSELLRLRIAAAAMAGGASPQTAMAAMRPPVFFKRQPIVTRILARWRSADKIDPAIRTALGAERACKQTATPDHAVCRQTLLALAGA
jgi:DNA polymerase-3 subunit delta